MVDLNANRKALFQAGNIWTNAPVCPDVALLNCVFTLYEALAGALVTTTIAGRSRRPFSCHVWLQA